MLSIILSASAECEAKAKEAGFVEKRVLVKPTHEMSTKELKDRLESECFALQPNQFLVSDYWGAGPE